MRKIFCLAIVCFLSFFTSASPSLAIEAGDETQIDTVEISAPEELPQAGNPEVFDIRIQGQSLEKIGSILRLTEKDLENKKIVISGRAQTDLGSVEAVEITLDEGKTSKTAQGTDQWIFSFEPQDGKEYVFSARARDSTQSLSFFDEIMPISIQYSKYTPNQRLALWFKNLREAYNAKNTKKCLALFSTDYTDGYTLLKSQLTKEFSISENYAINFYIDSIKLNADEDEAAIGFNFKKETKDKIVSGQAKAFFRLENVKSGTAWKLIRLDGTSFLDNL